MGQLHGGISLRTKFMLLLAVVTALVMITLGVSMASITNTFLFSQKQHDGIELARSISTLGQTIAADIVAKRHELAKDKDAKPLPLDEDLHKQIQQRIAAGLNHTRDWFNGQAFDNSDILAVSFDCPLIKELQGAGFGDREDSAQIGKHYSELNDVRTGDSVQLEGRGIDVYGATKRMSNGEDLPIYRFRIDLPEEYGKTLGANSEARPANVRVDIAARSVQRVASNLYMTIGIAVLIAISVVVGVAQWLASTITKPLVMLMRDMKTVAQGNLEHKTEAHSKDEIGVLASEFNRMTENLKIAQSALVEQEKAEYELSIAREVQRQLLPADAPTFVGFDCAAYYQGAKAVSGDYFDFIPLGDDLWGFIIADVSGKGIPGSMVMAVTRTIIRLVANKHRDNAAETLKETNRLIAKQIKRGMFVTACYAILDLNTRRLTYASAGHNPIVIYRAATKAYELAQGKGIALGFNEGPVFDKTIQQQTTVLGAGDAFFLYTDGFPEAMNAKNQEFGEEEFYQAIAAHGGEDVRQCVSHLVGAIAAHRGKHEQSDDLTMIAVRNTQGA
jgi:serine phosphatase RsbU (regulator of sigma subunit)